MWLGKEKCYREANRAQNWKRWIRARDHRRDRFLNSIRNYDKFSSNRWEIPISKRLPTHDMSRIFYMNRKAIQIILVIAISSAIPVSSAYVSYYTVASADFLSSNIGFEAFDQDYLMAANQSELKLSPLVDFLIGFQTATDLFGLSSHLSSQISSLDQKTLVLRC